jgi:hypothetical protein
MRQSVTVENKDTKKPFSLEEIHVHSLKKFKLPPVQRGYVWHPSQIENLWDSIFRGYPIGALVIAKDEENDLQLLDGQQRCTSISIGFTDHFDKKDDHKILRATHTPMLFIDLGEKKGNPDILFRVTTKFHPWGYLRDNNEKVISQKMRNEAITFFNKAKIEGFKPWTMDLCKSLPWDSQYPVPYIKFIKKALSVVNHDIKNEISDKELETLTDQLIEEIKKWHEEIGASEKYVEPESKKKFIKLVLKQTINLIADDELYEIPAVYMNKKEIDRYIKWKNELEVSKNTTQEDPDEESPIEKLFIRLNSGGTALTGEELNYSMVKDAIFKKFRNTEDKDKVEDIIKQIERISKYCSPARFITMAYKIFTWESEENSKISTRFRIKPREFARGLSNLKKDSKSFIDFLVEFATKEEKDELTKAEEFFEELIFTIDKPYGLPLILLRSIIHSSQELVTFYLHVRCQKPVSSQKAVAFITYGHWFGKIETKNNEELIKRIFQEINGEPLMFFERSPQDMCSLFSFKTGFDKVVFPLVLPENFRKKIDQTLNELKNKTFDKKKSNLSTFWDDKFIKEVINNKELILFGQREALHLWFSKEEFLLDDHNRPFDWDHIFPNNFAKKIKGFEFMTHLYQSIGNYRAWPFSENRSDQDDLPSTKFIKDNQRLHDKISKSCCDFSQNELDNILEKIDSTFTQKEDQQILVIQFLLLRTHDLYKKWYDQLDLKLFEEVI